MASPRFSSSGQYSTRVYVASTWSTGRPILFSSVSDPLAESSRTLARSCISSFLSSLPSRELLGKRVFDSVMDDSPNDSQTVGLASQVWQTLILYDSTNRDLQYLSLSSIASASATSDLKRLNQACWEKCCSLLYQSGETLISMHPAYVRSSRFSSERFVDLAITHSFLDPSLRSRWVRVISLLIHVHHQTRSWCDGQRSSCSG